MNGADDNKVIVQVDKTVVKITGVDVKGLNIQELESLLKDKLKSMVRIIGVTGSSLEMDVYGIEERYKAKLCGENDGKYWLTQVLDECQTYCKQPSEILAMRVQQAQSRPYADCNFLRKPFLEACQQIGVL